MRGSMHSAAGAKRPAIFGHEYGTRRRGERLLTRSNDAKHIQRRSMTPSTSLSLDNVSVWHETSPLFSPLTYEGRARRPRRRVYYLWHRGALSSPSRSRLKRFFDVACAGMALAALSPFLVAVAAAI